MRLATIALALVLTLPAAAQEKPHDRTFWTALAAKGFVVPDGEPVGALALEVAGLLSSPDPALRDGVGYEALARWVYRDGLVPPADLERLQQRLQSGLKKGLGETSGSSAYGRSFSAIGLSILAATDLKRPWLSQEAFDDLLTASAAYLGAERDVRAQKQALVHLAALLAREEVAPEAFRKTLDAALGKLAG